MSRLLRIGPLKQSLTETLEERYDVVALPNAVTDASERDAFLAEHAGGVRVLVTSGLDVVDRPLLHALPELGAVINFGVGHDHIDVAAAAERGVVVSNTPDVLDDCVADTAVGLVIDVMRGLSAADRFVRAGAWPTSGAFPLMRQVSGARVGILGLGRIGQAIATRLEAFGCPISYHNRHRVDGVEYAYATSPAALAASVDVLVVATAGGPSTRHLVDRSVIAALGPDGFLINVARGSVVDEDALVAALVAGELAGAGLDVYAEEPSVPDELVRMHNVVLLPHLASATVETRGAMERLVLENLEAFLADGRLLTPVEP